MFKERKIYNLVKKHLSQKQITVITGIRRSGKTTILKQLLSETKSSNQLYLDFQRIDNRELFSEKNYDNIVHALKELGLNFLKKTYIGLDEMQLVPEAASILKYLYDHYNIKFVVTGSSSFYLKNLFTESLSGRKKIFELFPLDFGEFLTFKNISFIKDENFLKKDFSDSEYERLKSYYEEYIKYGGFPEVVLSNNNQQKKDLLMDIISSYINIDLKTFIDLRDSRDIYQLVKMLAARIGTRLDYSKLSRLTGISRPKVQSYLDLLEKSYLIKRISVLAKKIDREIVKAQKIYFCDTGLANIIATLDGGTQFENSIFNQIHEKGKIRYYALKTSREIDFIFNSNYALEVKESPTEMDLRELKRIAKLAGLPKMRLVGRQPVLKFKNYIWGGEIR